MKIINGSPALASKGEISVTPTEIKIGQDVSAVVFSLIAVSGIIAGMFLPGAWWIYWIAGFGLGGIAMAKTPDRRPTYTADQIEKVQVLGTDRVGTKGAGGSLGGAAIGAVAFGGVGAIVGSVAGGNKVDAFTNVVVKFTDGEWVVVTSVSGLVGDAQYQNLLKMAGNNNACPI